MASGTRGLTAHLGIVEEATATSPAMLQQVLLPLLGMGGFALVAIATPGSEHNHYSQMMNLKDKNGEPLMMTIRTSLVCPACIDLGLNDACEHRLDLLPPWKSTVGMSKVRQILDGDVFLNQRENLGVITDGAHYFIKPAWVNDMRNPEHTMVVSANPRLVFIGIDPSGGGSSSSWACTAVYFQQGDCVICGGVRSSSFRSDEIDQMICDFFWSLRHHPRYAGAAFVVAIEGNMSYLTADRVAGIVMKDGIGPTIVLAEDGKKLGRYGVYTGHMEKCAYIEVIQALMIRGGLYWESKENFIGRFNRGADAIEVSMQKHQLQEFQNTMHDEMMNYRSERRDPKEVGWGPSKVAIFGKGPGKQDDTFMSLQIAVYWAQHKIGDDTFMDYCERNGWWSPGDELQIRVAVKRPPEAASASDGKRRKVDKES